MNRYRTTSRSTATLTTAVVALVILALGLAIPTQASTNSTQNSSDLDLEVRVEVNFVSEKEMRLYCPKRALGCAYQHFKAIYVGEDKRKGWSGRHYVDLRVKWIHGKTLRKVCKRTVSCFKDGIVYSEKLKLRSYRLSDLGRAISEAMGLKHSGRRVTTLGHEMVHILTGERHS